MLIVMAIMMLLFSIGVVAFGKAASKSEIVQCKSELAQLKSAIEMYRDRWGAYPIASTGNDNFLDFTAHLSKVEVGDGRFGTATEKRPMFIDFNKAGFDIDTDGSTAYDDVGTENDTSALDGFAVNDPWGNAYVYFYDSSADSDNFVVISAGPDLVSTDIDVTAWVDGVPTIDPEITDEGPFSSSD